MVKVHRNPQSAQWTVTFTPRLKNFLVVTTTMTLAALIKCWKQTFAPILRNIYGHRRFKTRPEGEASIY